MKVVFSKSASNKKYTKSSRQIVFDQREIEFLIY